MRCAFPGLRRTAMPDLERILVVEDDPVLRRAVQDTLAAEGYRVDVAVDGREGRASVCPGDGEHPYAAILLDIMLPGPSGLEVLRALRERDPHTPVLLLSARGEEHDKVTGLELGADDYVVKPFGKRELVARVRAMLRRRQAGPAGAVAEGPQQFEFGGCLVDLAGYSIRGPAGDHPLSPKEAGMLRLLWSKQGEVVSRSDFLELVWADARAVGNRTVDTHMLNLRGKVEVDPKQPKHLLTVHGVGYRLVP